MLPGHNICIVAGEASGDVHGGSLVESLKHYYATQNILPVFWGVAGPHMRNSGVDAFLKMEDFAVMGIAEVAASYFSIRHKYQDLVRRLQMIKPHLLIVIDYPGFNLRMAKWAHENGIKVDFYISPTVWAWKEGRVEIIKKYTNKLFVILPFEEAFYKKHNHKVYFVGHPLIDAIASSIKALLS